MSFNLAFPRLTIQNYRVTSPPTENYNCIAWSVGDRDRWWQPGIFWPIAATPGDFGIATLVAAMTALGFVPCLDELEEPGFEKVALFGDTQFYTHAARQLPGGKWTSKLGKSEDIEHDTPADLADGVYGSVVGFMKRLRATAPDGAIPERRTGRS